MKGITQGGVEEEPEEEERWYDELPSGLSYEKTKESKPAMPQGLSPGQVGKAMVGRRSIDTVQGCQESRERQNEGKSKRVQTWRTEKARLKRLV